MKKLIIIVIYFWGFISLGQSIYSAKVYFRDPSRVSPTTQYFSCGHDLTCDPGTHDNWEGKNLGRYEPGSNIQLGGNCFTDYGDRDRSYLAYSIYKEGSSGTFTEIELNYVSFCNDWWKKKWEETSLQNITLPTEEGNYIIAVYFRSRNWDNTNNHYYSNSGNNYKAKIQITKLSAVFESYVYVNLNGTNTFYNLDAADSSNISNFLANAGTFQPGLDFKLGSEQKVYTHNDHKVCECSSWYYVYNDDNTLDPLESDFPLPSNGTNFIGTGLGKFTKGGIMNQTEANTSTGGSTNDNNYNTFLNGFDRKEKYQNLGTHVNSTIIFPTCTGDYRIAIANLTKISTTNDCANQSSLIYRRDINEDLKFKWNNSSDITLNPKWHNQTISSNNLFYTTKITISSTGGTAIYNGTWSSTPDKSKDVTINTNLIIDGTTDNESFSCNNLTIADGVTLTINGSRFVEVLNNAITIGNGKIVIENEGSFVQRCDLSSMVKPNIHFKKTTRPLKAYDYSYFGSPITTNVVNQLNAVNGGNGDYDWIFRWNSNGASSAWTSTTTSTPGQGFVARRKNLGTVASPNPTAGNATAFNLQWNGIANNGKINYTAIAHASTPTENIDANKILISNPYPSAIDAVKLINHSENQELDGTLYFWTANLPVSNIIPGSYVYNYSSNDYSIWNLTGSTITTASLTNNTGAESLRPSGKIASGQGFFARIKQSGTIEFTNDMRLTTDNSQFFRMTNENYSDNNYNYPKVWLNLTSADNPTFRQILIGYVPMATNSYEAKYDAETYTTSNNDFYSVIDNKKLNIQGRLLPFNDLDTVTLGLKIENAGNYFISLDQTEGILSNNEISIYIKDNLTNTEHNLKNSPFGFNVPSGTINDRFVLKYQSTLSNNSINLIENNIWIVSQNNINIQSKLEKITAIEIYDLVGRKIFSNNEFDSNQVILEHINKNNQVLIAKIKLADQTIVNKKFIF
jgi:hypothetical protein